ncbi:suppressor of hpr1, variant 2 [Entomophthora muscae]|uniref:Suppressor of hpr1, variant 2 n=1 Tax=Entomophthora muscae TaxID=34485 RepID=A0ACC2TWQ6_9FUNG|nr:suppressor of hpr1, variant 2 [Entomophthora muscae]
MQNSLSKCHKIILLILSYPMALYFLDLLQHSDFRDAMKTQEATVFVHEKQYYHWLYARRPKIAMEPVEDEPEPLALGSELPTET